MSVLLPLNISKGLRWPLFRLKCAKGLLRRAPGRALCLVHFFPPPAIVGLRYKMQFCKTDHSKPWKDKRIRARLPPRIKACMFSCLHSPIWAFSWKRFTVFFGINTNYMQSGEFKTAMKKSSQRSSSVPPPTVAGLRADILCPLPFLPFHSAFSEKSLLNHLHRPN